MFICMPSILYFVFWTKYAEKAGKIRNVVLFVFLSTAIILCLSFPYHYEGDYLFDFRLIPLVLGILYGGPRVGAALLLLLMAYRCMIGGDGVYVALLVAAGTYSTLAAIASKTRLNTRAKLFRALFLSTALVPISFKIFWCIAIDATYDSMILHVSFRVIKYSGICITVYLVEFVSSYFSMQKELLEIEKMRVMSQIAASVSHEIRNPLTTVKGFLQLFNERELSASKRGNFDRTRSDRTGYGD